MNTVYSRIDTKCHKHLRIAAARQSADCGAAQTAGWSPATSPPASAAATIGCSWPAWHSYAPAADAQTLPAALSAVTHTHTHTCK